MTKNGSVLKNSIALFSTLFYLIFTGECLTNVSNFSFEQLMQSRPPATTEIDDLDNEQASGDFGYVNFKTLLLFHPRMKVYNFKVNNFYRPVPNDLKVPLKYYLEDRERKSVDLIKSLRTVHQNHNRKLSALYRDKTRVFSSFKEQKRLLLRDKLANQEAELIELNAKENNEIAEVSRKIQITKKQMQDLYDKSFGVHYLKLEERQAEFKKIESEVKNAIESIRLKHKLVFILNNQVGDFNDLVKPNSRMFEYSGFVEMNKLWKFLHRTKVLQSGELDKIRLVDDVESMLDYYNRQVTIGSIFQLPSINQFVLAGGRDMTLQCLAEVYLKYKYPREKIIRLINIIAQLDKGEGR